MADQTRAQAMLAEANRNLDMLGNALATGHNAAPDLVMRGVQAMRDRLERHAPRLCRDCPESRQHYECTYCGSGRNWPCPDVAADFTVIGPDLNAEESDRADG